MVTNRRIRMAYEEQAEERAHMAAYMHHGLSEGGGTMREQLSS